MAIAEILRIEKADIRVLAEWKDAVQTNTEGIKTIEK